MEEIEIKVFNLKNKEIETVIVKDYGIVQAIEKVRFQYSYECVVLSSIYVDILEVISEFL